MLGIFARVLIEGCLGIRVQVLGGRDARNLLTLSLGLFTLSFLPLSLGFLSRFTFGFLGCHLLAFCAFSLFTFYLGAFCCAFSFGPLLLFGPFSLSTGSSLLRGLLLTFSVLLLGLGGSHFLKAFACLSQRSAMLSRLGQTFRQHLRAHLGFGFFNAAHAALIKP